MTDLVLLGAGHAHVEVLRRFARRPDPGLRLTLIAREPWTPYSGRLPALIRGECGVRDAHIDLGPLAAAADARLVITEATGVDLEARQVAVRGRPAIRFDWLSIDIGGVPAMPEGRGIAVKPIGGFLAALTSLEQELEDGAAVALVGGGAAGVELALALAQRFAGRPRITLICDTAEPLADAPAKVRGAVRAALSEAGVELVCGVRAGAHADGRVALSDGSFLAANAVLWATNVVGPTLLAESGLSCDPDGCVAVDASLRSRGQDRVFAAGDCASIVTAPRPKAGVWAVRAGPLLAENLRRAAHGRRLHAWRPQGAALAIVGLGHGRAVAWRGGVALSGHWIAGTIAWYKDWIDRRFLRRYMPASLPRRGARIVPAQVRLDPADLALLPSPAGSQVSRENLAHGIVSHGIAGGALAGPMPVQIVTDLPALLNDPFNFGRIAAAHALVQLHATCADGRPAPETMAGTGAWTAVAIANPPNVPLALARADVMAMLHGAAEILAADGVALRDCVTASGGQPAVSLVLTSSAATVPGRAGTLRGGDALILTKKLGSGVILEGYRRGLADAHWLAEAIGSMTQSSAAAGRILRQHEASVCAAVGEHGVIGTLAELLRIANLVAVLERDGVQVLSGARELARLGVERPLAAENRSAWPEPPDWPDLPLLMDPQIAGGILAGVPEAQAAACLEALRAAGYGATRIGQSEARRLGAPRLRMSGG